MPIDAKTSTHETGVLRAETMAAQEIDALLGSLAKASDDALGNFCFLGDYVRAPYSAVFDYCADVRSLSEWTMNIGPLERVEENLYRGKMIFSREDAPRPTTDIFIRAEPLKGPDHGMICYPCAWDEADELWMRYYFILTDAQKTLGKPGTVVLWVNCKHPYYDRATTDVPKFVREGRERTDRPWAGDGWSGFYPLHQVELTNLKRIAESRFGALR